MSTPRCTTPTRSRRRGARALAVGATIGLTAAAAACEPVQDTVTVRYKQLGACNGFSHAAGLTSAGVGAAFVVFKVETIDNRQPGARPYHFHPAHFYVNGTQRHHTSGTTLDRINPFGAVPLTVPAGAIRTVNGAMTAVVRVAGEADEANRTNYFLYVANPGGAQGVFPVKVNADQTRYPATRDCRLIDFGA